MSTIPENTANPELPTRGPSALSTHSEAMTAPASARQRPRRARRGGVLNLTVMALAAGLVATMALPAYAFQPATVGSIDAQSAAAPAPAAQQLTDVSGVTLEGSAARGSITATTREELDAARAAEQARLERERLAAEAAAAAAEAGKAAASASTSPSRVSSSDPTVPSVSGSVVWPVGRARVSAGFGPRNSPCSGCSSDHKGVDFDAGANYPIAAAADGVVKEAKFNGTYGWWVLIEHVVDGQRVQTGYAHLNAPALVSAGQAVSAGQRIGAVGASGNVSGANLHFELRVGGRQVDPSPWLQRNAG